MAKKMNALKLQKNLSQVLDEVFQKGDQYVIERAGRPMAAVVPLWQFEDRRKRKERFFGMVKEVGRRNKKEKSEVIAGEVEEAVKAVRGKASRRRR
jgi:prevent-host-death family protein